MYTRHAMVHVYSVCLSFLDGGDLTVDVIMNAYLHFIISI